MKRTLTLVAGIGLLALTGCGPTNPTEVAVIGVVTEGPSAPQVDERVAGAQVSLLSRDGLTQHGQTLSGATGGFAIGGLPLDTRMALVVGLPDLNDPHSFSVFTGQTDSDDTFFLTGTVFTPELEDTIQVIDDYAASPGAPAVLGTYTVNLSEADNGGMVRGRVGRWFTDQFNNLFFEQLAGATVEVVDKDGTSHPVCYRTDPVLNTTQGLADCSLSVSSLDSSFAAFGLPAGSVSITISHPDYAEVTDDTLIVEDGVTYLDFFALQLP